MKHTAKIMKGFYQTKKHEYPVIVDKYSGNNYRIIKVYDDAIAHMIGKDVQRYHGFRYAVKKDMPSFPEE